MKNQNPYSNQQNSDFEEEECDFGDTDECVVTSGNVSTQQRNGESNLPNCNLDYGTLEPAQPILTQNSEKENYPSQQQHQQPVNQDSKQQVSQASLQNVQSAQSLQKQSAPAKRVPKNNQSSVLIQSQKRNSNEGNQQSANVENQKSMPYSKSTQNLQGAENNNFQTFGTTAAGFGKDDPENESCFHKAYLKLVQKVYQEQGTNILITQDELNRLVYTQSNLSVQDFQQRIQQCIENKTQKVRMLEEMKKQAELQECTFKPQIIHKSHTEKRNLEQFLKDQANFQEQRKRKVQERTQQTEIQKHLEMKQQPLVNKKSARMMEKKKKQAVEENQSERMQTEQPVVFERLHNIHQEKLQKQSKKIMDIAEQERQLRNNIGSRNFKKTKSEVNFLTARSREREGKTVDEMLYEDAKRRWEKQQMQKKVHQKLKEDQVQQSKPPTHLNNLRYAAQKYEKEFYFAVYQIMGEPHPIEDDQTQEINVKDFDDKVINYVKLGQLMTEMGYLPVNASTDSIERELLYDMWNMMLGEENSGVRILNIKKLLLAIQNISLDFILGNPPSENSMHKSNSTQDRQSILQVDYDDHGVIKISQQEVNKIFVKFKSFYVNRVQFQGTQKRVKPVDENCTFKPQISKTTEQLAQQRRLRLLSQDGIDVEEDTKIDLVQILLQPIQQQEQWMQSAKEILVAKELEECTFKPQIITKGYDSNKSKSGIQSDRCLELYHKSKNGKEKRDKTKEDYEFEKARDHCTFQPNIEDSQKTIEMVYYNQNAHLAGSKDNHMFQGVYSPDHQNEQTQHIKGYEQVTSRMRKGREERERARVMMQRGLPVDESLLQPLQFQANQNFKGVFSTYGQSTEYNGTNSMMNSNTHQPYQSKMSDSKQKNNQPLVEKDMMRKRSSSGRGFKSGAQIKKEKREGEKENNPDYAPSNQQRYGQAVLGGGSSQQQKPQPRSILNSNQKFTDQKRKGITSSPNSSIDIRFDSDEKSSNVNILSSDGDYDPTSSQKTISMKQPLLYVDVNLGPGKSERIVVFDGDTADSLADKFALTHGLDSNMRGKLAQLLDSQISGLLEKIEEEQNSTHSDLL